MSYTWSCMDIDMDFPYLISVRVRRQVCFKAHMLNICYTPAIELQLTCLDIEITFSLFMISV